MNKPITQALAALLLAFVCFGCASAPAPRQGPPNIVIFFTDDMGYADPACYGSMICTTPHIDDLADRGMRFTDFYVSAAVCSASRSSMMTGCYPLRVGIQGALGPSSQVGLNPQETTLAQLVKPLGYATCAIGKWHLGHLPQHLPTRHGFDEYLGLPYSNDMWPWHYGDQDRGVIGNPNWPDLPVIDGTETIELNPRQESLTPRYTERALDFIDRSADQPFLLYFAYSHPHIPIAASERFRGSTGNGLYADMIAEIDDSVGQVVARLEELGLTDNTLIIFSSDNGPWTRFGNYAGQTGPLRGDKGTCFEGGMRVPGIFCWPGNIPAGAETDAIATTMDVLPTIAAFTGAELPALPIDGHDLSPLLTGRSTESPTDALYYYNGNELHAVRVGDWKLHLPHRWREVVEQGVDGQPGPERQTPISLSLYNLRDDVGESNNLADQHPEIVERLMVYVERARADLGDSLTDRQGEGRREPGR